MFCSAVEPIVHGLEKTYGEKMDFMIQPFDSAESKARIERYGIELHGMVITNAADEVVWLESGHEQERTVVEAEVRKRLGE